ncbi:MAG: hypothetical protein E7Z63_02100 [Thermoplasmata archaeon]|nr:hypothetical protein [Thermoplasmata archaeon]
MRARYLTLLLCAVLFVTAFSANGDSDSADADDEVAYHFYLDLIDESGTQTWKGWIPQYIVSGGLSDDNYLEAVQHAVEAMGGSTEVYEPWHFVNDITLDGDSYHVYEWGVDDPYYGFGIYYSDGTGWKPISNEMNDGSTIGISYGNYYVNSEPPAEEIANYTNHEDYWTRNPDAPQPTFDQAYNISVFLDDGTNLVDTPLAVQNWQSISSEEYVLSMRGAIHQAGYTANYDGNKPVSIKASGTTFAKTGTWGSAGYMDYYVLYQDAGVWKLASTYAESASYTICYGEYLFSEPTGTAADKYVDCGTYWVKKPIAEPTTVISGTVSDSSSNPISGATVSFGSISATTDTDGTYVLKDLTSGTQTFTISATGYEGYSTSITMNEGDIIVKNVTLTSASTTSNVSGKVTGTYGAALSGVTVSIGSMNTTTDSSGSYAFSDVPEGDYTITATKSGYDDYSEPFHVNAGFEITKNIAMTAEYDPSEVRTPYHIYLQFNDGNGNEWSGWLPEFIASGDPSPSNYALAINMCSQFMGGEADVNDGFINSITVGDFTYANTDWDDEPYYGFYIYYADGSEWALINSFAEGSTLVITYDRFYRITDTEPEPPDELKSKYLYDDGSWVRIPDIAVPTFPQEYSISLFLNNGTDKVDTTLDAQEWISNSANYYILSMRGAIGQAGFIATFDGYKPTSITVNSTAYAKKGTWGTDGYYDYYITYLDGSDWKIASTYTESNAYTICYGKFYFTEPSSTVIDKYIAGDGYWVKKPIEDTDGSVTGKVTDTTSAPVAGATVTLGSDSTTAAADGSYTFTDVPAGTYTFTVSASGYDDYSVSLVVAEGDSLVKNVVMGAPVPTTSTVSGKVTGQYGAALSGVAVTLGTLSTTTDSTGSYTFTDVAGGSYTLTAKKDGYEDYSLDIFVNEGVDTTKNIAMTPKAAPTDVATVRGVVTGSNNEPLPGATVTVGEFTATTDATGSYVIKNIPPGTYTLTIALEGYTTYTKEGIVLAIGDDITANAVLTVPAPEPEEKDEESAEHKLWKTVAICLVVVCAAAVVLAVLAHFFGPAPPTPAAAAPAAVLGHSVTSTGADTIEKKEQRFGGKKDKGIDNSWIESDRAASGQAKMLKTKTLITVIVVIAAALGVIAFHDLGSNATLYQSQGIVIDYGDYKTVWTDVDYDLETEDPLEMLDIACTQHDIARQFDSDGNLYSVEYYDYLKRETVANNENHKWGLWTVDYEGGMKQSDTYSIDASDYNVVIWAYTETGGKPTIAVDSTNTSVYGYSQASRVVTLSPVSTEIVSYVSGPYPIVGTDSYSDYPASIKTGRDNGTIATVGTFLSPSYESILNANPDIVVCDGSAGSHISMAEKVRSSSVNAVVLYDAVDIQSIYDNIFIVSTAMAYYTAADKIDTMQKAIAQIDAKIKDAGEKTIMVSLGAYASPYVAGKDTYMDNILSECNGDNVFGNIPGWPLITAEYIPQNNPSMAIVIDDGKYSKSSYDTMIHDLGNTQWKNTDAYKDGEIYLFSEDMGSMAQRASPRFIQLYEITARILNPDCFDDDAQKLLNDTKAIGSEYQDYLTYTKGVM